MVLRRSHRFEIKKRMMQLYFGKDNMEIIHLDGKINHLR